MEYLIPILLGIFQSGSHPAGEPAGLGVWTMVIAVAAAVTWFIYPSRD